MRQFKDFLVTEDTITEDDGVLLPEGFVYDQEPLLEGVTAHKKIGDPPAVLIMRRTSIRMFPNGQRIALYKVIQKEIMKLIKQIALLKLFDNNQFY